ncbi:MAG: CDP-alcohol phosphatidyltransferase family protein, partial [Nitrospinales bacterium]
SEESRISSANDFSVQHERLLQTGGALDNDSFLTRLFSRPVSRWLTRFFIGAPFTPNQITLASFALGLASAWCFFQGGYELGVAGGGLMLLAIWVDGVDGEIARLKFMESEFGGKLDIICDNVVHLVLFYSIGMGVFHATGQGVYKLLGGLAVMGSLVSFLIMSASIIRSKSQTGLGGSESGSNLADKFANRDFTYFLVLTALAGRMDFFIAITAVGSNVFALYLLYIKFRSSRRLP